MSDKPSLPFSKQIAYAIGQLGWSTLVNIVTLILVFFYQPPADAGVGLRITQVTFFVVINAITLIAASGRIVDAITDPLIANWSDRSTHRRGRRIPFMAVGALPAAVLCVFMFVPPVDSIHVANLVWLTATQILFFTALTFYVTPYFALLAELGHTAKQRLNLSTLIAITYALGVILAASTPVLANVFESALGITDRMKSLQCAVAALSALAFVFMMVPILTINEKVYCQNEPSSAPLMDALRSTFRKRSFRYYVLSDFTFFTGLTIITTGLLYYVTVLLALPEAMALQLMTIMVVLAFLLYPVVNILARRLGKKPLVVGSTLAMSVVFFFIYFLGKLPVSTTAQAYGVAVCFAVPFSFLSVLPMAILADIADHDAMQTGERKEGMFFAARTLMQKFGVTFGVLIFASLTTLGRDRGDDLGIRLSGMVGFVLCFVAGLIFLRYDEKSLLREMEELQRSKLTRDAEAQNKSASR